MSPEDSKPSRPALDPETRATIEASVRRSHAGEISFGEVVVALAGVGVESYYADYRQGRLTYYFPSGLTHEVELQAPGLAVAEAFDGDAVRAAIRGAQAGEVFYPEFVRRTVAAGCVGYFVWITGRHVRYLGRRGESHVEEFPSR